jgi:hypothetical protein
MNLELRESGIAEEDGSKGETSREQSQLLGAERLELLKS